MGSGPRGCSSGEARTQCQQFTLMVSGAIARKDDRHASEVRTILIRDRGRFYLGNVDDGEEAENHPVHEPLAVVLLLGGTQSLHGLVHRIDIPQQPASKPARMRVGRSRGFSLEDTAMCATDPEPRARSGCPASQVSDSPDWCLERGSSEISKAIWAEMRSSLCAC